MSAAEADRLEAEWHRLQAAAVEDFVLLEAAWERPENRPVAMRFILRMAEVAAEAVRELGLERRAVPAA